MPARSHRPPIAPDADFRAAAAWVFSRPHSPDPSAPQPTNASKRDPHRIIRVPGSTRSYTQAQLDAGPVVPDWFPSDHPPAPRIVMEQSKPGFPVPCAGCHLPNGQGDIMAPAIAGLPRAYIVEQITAFRQDKRRAPLMAREAQTVNDADLNLAMDYFSRLPYRSRTRVIEAATVPKTHWKSFVLMPDRNGAREPIGMRIIETPVDIRAHEAMDDHAEVVAYVADGRNNAAAAPMRAEVSHLTLKDMIDVAAHAASRKP